MTNAVEYLLDCQKNRGTILYSRNHSHIVRVVRFWRQFRDDDRPFATGLHLTVRQEDSNERPTKVPITVLSPTDLVALARFNGGRGTLNVPKEYR